MAISYDDMKDERDTALALLAETARLMKKLAREHAEAFAALDEIRQAHDRALDDLREMRDAYDEARSKLVDARRGVHVAIDELQRWQYSEDPSDVRHSIDMAVRTLERTV